MLNRSSIFTQLSDLTIMSPARHTADEHGAMPTSNECTEKHPQDDFPVRASFHELAERHPAFTHNVPSEIIADMIAVDPSRTRPTGAFPQASEKRWRPDRAFACTALLTRVALSLTATSARPEARCVRTCQPRPLALLLSSGGPALGTRQLPSSRPLLSALLPRRPRPHRERGFWQHHVPHLTTGCYRWTHSMDFRGSFSNRTGMGAAIPSGRGRSDSPSGRSQGHSHPATSSISYTGTQNRNNTN